jgi:hypothetical protein
MRSGPTVYENASAASRIGAVLTLLLLGLTQIPTGSASAEVCCHLNPGYLSSMPDVPGADGQNVWWGVEGIAPDDALVVGKGGSPLKARARHWDGAQWTRSGAPGRTYSELYGVSARTASDAWAVGHEYRRSIAIHWDGNAWARTNTPPPSHDEDQDTLKAVTAISPDNAWAVGRTRLSGGGNYAPLVEHWTGHAWTKTPVKLPYHATDGIFNGVSAVSASDVWAVGDVAGQSTEPLLEHWTGTKWHPVTKIRGAAGVHLSVLDAVSARSADDVWAVGGGSDDSGYISQILHYDGHTWRYIPSPSGDLSISQLFGVSAISADDVWAAGFTWGDFFYAGHTMTLHWNGHEWSRVPSPNFGQSGSTLWGISAVSSKDVWAVGSGTNDLGDTYFPVILHWDGTAWTRK